MEKIGGWGAAGAAHIYFPTIHEEFEQANIRRFSQLMPRTDSMLLSAVKGIVEGREHHCVLGLLNEEYRKVFFTGKLPVPME
ncbi:MAG: hypothetical protein HGB32_09840 [Geobacteraceae bacterium]|nr:hypothetical protein [Geobacteraceae bacterium]NTW80436.1 hypothetical protein [Geobacteraceae bacterium]